MWCCPLAPKGDYTTTERNQKIEIMRTEIMLLMEEYINECNANNDYGDAETYNTFFNYFKIGFSTESEQKLIDKYFNINQRN